MEKFEAFYASDTTPAGRKALLNQLRTNGVTYVVTKADAPWVASLSWQVIQSQGVWELRAAPPAP